MKLLIPLLLAGCAAPGYYEPHPYPPPAPLVIPKVEYHPMVVPMSTAPAQIICTTSSTPGLGGPTLTTTCR